MVLPCAPYLYKAGIEAGNKMRIGIRAAFFLFLILAGSTSAGFAGGGSLAQANQYPASIESSDEMIKLWSEGLGETSYSNPSFKFEVTFMKIDVADIEARLDQSTAADLEAIVMEGNPDRARIERAASVLLAAEISAYRFTFLRDGGTGRFLEGTRSNLDSARKDGIISEPEFLSIWNDYRRIMGPIEKRGSFKGDQLLYRIEKGALRIIYIGKDGDVLVDSIQSGDAWARGFKGSFSSRNSAFREKLLRSLWSN